MGFRENTEGLTVVLSSNTRRITPGRFTALRTLTTKGSVSLTIAGRPARVSLRSRPSTSITKRSGLLRVKCLNLSGASDSRVMRV